MSERIKKALAGFRSLWTKRSAGVVRVLSQLAFFLLSPGLFASALAGVKSIAAAMGSGSSIEMSANLTVLILLLGFTLLFGRFFCGCACAFGALQDGIWFLSGLLFRKKRGKRRPVELPNWLRFIKYGVLIAVLAVYFSGNQALLRGKSPWDAFAQIVGGHVRLSDYRIGFLLLTLSLIGTALVPRFFCRFLCPMGALFSILPPALLARIQKPREANEKYKACGNCKLCSNGCPAGLKLSGENAITSGECLCCLRCADACYQKKPKYSILGLVPNGWIALSLLAVLLAALVWLFGL